jgi:hypothetical protein
MRFTLFSQFSYLAVCSPFVDGGYGAGWVAEADRSEAPATHYVFSVPPFFTVKAIC